MYPNDQLLHSLEAAKRVVKGLEQMVEDSQTRCPHPTDKRRWTVGKNGKGRDWCRDCHKVLYP